MNSHQHNIIFVITSKCQFSSLVVFVRQSFYVRFLNMELCCSTPEVKIVSLLGKSDLMSVLQHTFCSHCPLKITSYVPVNVILENCMWLSVSASSSDSSLYHKAEGLNWSFCSGYTFKCMHKEAAFTHRVMTFDKYYVVFSILELIQKLC